MKRATGHPVRALFFQRDIVLHDAHNVRLAFEIINEGLWKTHERFMNQQAKNVKSSSVNNSGARALNDSSPTIILFQVSTANKTDDELRDA